jgi:hypothetical protein
MFVSGSMLCADLLWLTFYRIAGSHDVEIGPKTSWCSRILPRRPLGRLWPSCARRPGRATKGNCNQRNPFMWSVGKTEVSFWVGAGTGRAGAQGQKGAGTRTGTGRLRGPVVQGSGGPETRPPGTRTPRTRSRAEGNQNWSSTILDGTGRLTLTTL